MAKPSSLTLSLLLLFFIVLTLSSTTTIQVEALGGKVGSREKIPDVKTNEEVQELGKYCVAEHNRNQRQKGNGTKRQVAFLAVVEAEKQVVSGIKYYLKISATTSSGVPKIFDAVLVVQAWKHTKQLLNFSPSPPTK